MGLGQLFGLGVNFINLVLQSSQVALQAFMFAHQLLDLSQILAHFFRVEGILLLVDPVLDVIDVAVERLDLGGALELVGVGPGPLADLAPPNFLK